MTQGFDPRLFVMGTPHPGPIQAPNVKIEDSEEMRVVGECLIGPLGRGVLRLVGAGSKLTCAYYQEK